MVQLYLFLSWAIGFSIAVMIHKRIGSPKYGRAVTYLTILAGLLTASGNLLILYPTFSFINVLSILTGGVASAMAFTWGVSVIKTNRVMSISVILFPILLLSSVYITITDESLIFNIAASVILGCAIGLLLTRLEVFLPLDES